MTQSGRNKKSPQPKVVISDDNSVDFDPRIKDPEPTPPKSDYQILIERLKEEKPHIYEQYNQAIKQQKRAYIGPDLSLRIG